ncbi:MULTISPECIES: monofunctional biosynthetic peptidoglycan transglycosylase [unclassified Lonepinella]|uniref:monofunctional biosynthetic peptidoglycan transglycosylase n=1 Tax=unclassified Lonepinella TaxID=2642006 RepID=UPI0036D85BC4
MATSLPLCLKKCGAFLWRFLLGFLLLTLVLRFVPIPLSAYMLQQKLGHLLHLDFDYDIQHHWVSLDEISSNMQLAVIAAEDQHFPNHYGFDLNAIEKAFNHNQISQKIRGASTISQQTAKNLYLWHGQSWLRKGLEVPITLTLETLWSKKRILEVYLNIAEFGYGIFGVEAASQYYFKKPAKKLTKEEAALLAAVLPNPISFKVLKPGRITKRKQAWILRQMNLLGKDYLKKLD